VPATNLEQAPLTEVLWKENGLGKCKPCVKETIWQKFPEAGSRYVFPTHMTPVQGILIICNFILVSTEHECPIPCGLDRSPMNCVCSFLVSFHNFDSAISYTFSTVLCSFTSAVIVEGYLLLHTAQLATGAGALKNTLLQIFISKYTLCLLKT
jgi:hypothetical protein